MKKSSILVASVSMISRYMLMHFINNHLEYNIHYCQLVNLILKGPPEFEVSWARLTLVCSGWRMLSDAPSPTRTAVTETIVDGAGGRVVVCFPTKFHLVHQPVWLLPRSQGSPWLCWGCWWSLRGDLRHWSWWLLRDLYWGLRCSRLYTRMANISNSKS